MMKDWSLRIAVFVLIGWSAANFSILTAQSGATSIYSADKVRVSTYLSADAVHPGESFDAALQLDIEDHWHINSNQPVGEFLIATEVILEPSSEFELLGMRYPPGQLYQFSFSEEPVDVYEGTAYIYLNLRSAEALEAGDYQLMGRLIVQACDDMVCLAPSEKPLSFEISVVEPHVEISSAHADIFSPERMYTVGKAAPAGASQDVLDLAAMFDDQGWLLFFGAVFLVGLALNLTPCVYPMMTVTLSVFGTQTDPSTFRVFLRALVYVLGISTMYSLLGLIAALSGGLFGAVLQSPWVLVGIAVLFLLLALSMFGLYEIQMPHWLTRRLGGTTVAGTLGLYVSGLVVGVFAAPCIGPPIIALLALVGQRADPVFGFTSFFVLSLGLGFPYLILGTFSGLMTRLPRSGVWMVWVKKVFGVVLVAVGVFYLCLAFRPDWIYVLIPLTLVVGGAYLGFVESSRGAHYLFPWIKRAAGVLIAGIGLLFYFAGQKPSLDWTPYSSERLAAAQQDSRPAVLYFAADWCLPCLELDRLTFTDREVINRMDRLVRLKVDLTQYDSPDSQSLRERYNIAGVPTIIFLEPRGDERADLRIVGYVPASELLRRVDGLQELHARTGAN